MSNFLTNKVMVEDAGAGHIANPAAERNGQLRDVIINGIGFPRLPSFKKGTWPTLLDESEAVKVKKFIENWLYNTRGRLATGSPQTNRFEFTFGPDGNNVELWLQTDLRWDRSPMLMANLNANGEIIYSPITDLYLAHGGPDGVRIQNQSGDSGLLKLAIGMPGVDTKYTGHRTNAAPNDTVYVWPNDGTSGYVLSTDGAGNLSWVSNSGGGGGGMTSFSVDGDSGPAQTITNGNTLLILGGNGLDSVASATDTITLAIDDTLAQAIAITADGGTASGDSTVNIDNHSTANTLGLVAGDNVTLTGTDSAGTIKIESSASGGSGAPTDASYVVMGLNSSLSAERKLTAGTGISITDGGANGNVTVAATSAGSGMASFDVTSVDDSNTVTINTTDNTLSFETKRVGATTPDDVKVLDIQLDTTSQTLEFHAKGMPYFTVEDNIGSTEWRVSNPAYIETSSGVDYDAKIKFMGGIGTGPQIRVNAVDHGEVKFIHEDSGVTGGEYGSATTVPVIEVDNQGHLTSVTNETIDKAAMVPGIEPDEFLELTCIEAPEVRFEDVLELETDGFGIIEAQIDPEFVHVCEADSIKAVGYTTSDPALAGIRIEGAALKVTFGHAAPIPETITIKLSGIRKGRAGKRFTKRTAAEAEANNKFWGQWRKK